MNITVKWSQHGRGSRTWQRLQRACTSAPTCLWCSPGRSTLTTRVRDQRRLAPARGDPAPRQPPPRLLRPAAEPPLAGPPPPVHEGADCHPPPPTISNTHVPLISA